MYGGGSLSLVDTGGRRDGETFCDSSNLVLGLLMEDASLYICSAVTTKV